MSREQYDDALEAIRQLDAELGAIRERVAELEPLEDELGEANAKYRSLEAARAYDKLAEELKVRPEVREDVWKLLDHKIEGEAFDEKALRDGLSKFLGERKHYVSGGDKEPSRLAKGDGSGRSARDDGFGDGDAKQRVTYAQLRDPEFTSRNSALLADVSKYEIVEA